SSFASPPRPLFLNAPPTTATHTLSLHDALPIYDPDNHQSVTKNLSALLQLLPNTQQVLLQQPDEIRVDDYLQAWAEQQSVEVHRSEEHTSELQSRENLVCRLLLEKTKKKKTK